VATLIPNINPDEIANSGERRVAIELIRQLPRKVTVYHSFEWVAEHPDDQDGSGYRKNGRIEGETDFLILHPDLGIIALEVKDGPVRFRQDQGGFYREYANGRREKITSPLSQGRKGIHVIENLLRKRPEYQSLASLPFSYRYGAVLPEVSASGDYPAEAEPELILDVDDLEDLPKALHKLVTKWEGKEPRPVASDDIHTIKSTLIPHFHLCPILAREVEREEDILIRLTEIQVRALNMLQRQETAAIEGVAGSGKTLLALRQAQLFAAAPQGLRTLLLCYNDPLADWLKKIVPEELADRLVVSSFHGLCEDLCNEYQVPIPAFDDRSQQFWEEDSAVKLAEAACLAGPDQRFDAIVIDEGQDFRPLWWECIDELYRSPEGTNQLFVFYDPRQNFYVPDFTLPDRLGPPYPLDTNCRNTRAIAEHCGNVIDEEIPTLDDAPTGIEPILHQATDRADALRLIEKQVAEWTHSQDGRLRPSQIAILVLSTRGVAKPDTLAKIPLTTDHDTWRANQAILFEGWRRFKGLEADALIVLLPPKSIPISETDKYVAFSRARHLLAVVEETSAETHDEY